MNMEVLVFSIVLFNQQNKHFYNSLALNPTYICLKKNAKIIVLPSVFSLFLSVFPTRPPSPFDACYAGYKLGKNSIKNENFYQVVFRSLASKGQR